MTYTSTQIITKEILANIRIELKEVLGTSIKVTSNLRSKSTNTIKVLGGKRQGWHLTTEQKELFHNWAEQNNTLNYNATPYDRSMPCNYLGGDIVFILESK
jgi:hypothetical protein